MSLQYVNSIHSGHMPQLNSLTILIFIVTLSVGYLGNDNVVNTLPSDIFEGGSVERQKAMYLPIHMSV